MLPSPLGLLARLLTPGRIFTLGLLLLTGVKGHAQTGGLPALIGRDTLVLKRFADSCLRSNADAWLIENYKAAVDHQYLNLESSHLAFLLKLHQRTDRRKPSLTNYFICLYIGKTITKYHLDEHTPLGYFQEAAQIAEKLDDKCLAAQAYANMVSFYTNIRHDLLKANEQIAFVRQYLENAKLDGIVDCNIDLNVRSSVLNYYLQDYDKGISELNLSIAIVKRLDRPQQLYDLYKRRAFFEIELTRYQDAFLSIDSAELVVKDLPDKKSFLNHLLAMRFNAWFGKGDIGKATFYSKRVDAEALQDDNDDYFDYMTNLIKLQTGFGQYEEAEANVEAYMALMKPWNIQRWRRLYEAKYILEKNKGDDKAALEAFEKFKYYDDSVHHQRQNYTIRQQQVKYETRQKEKSLQTQLALNRLYFWIIIIVLAMAVAIILLIYANYRRSRKNIRVLQLLNEQINAQKSDLEKANEEMDRILHVVAHDLRSPIGGISYVSDLILMGKPIPAEAKKNLNLIKKAAANSLSLINELLGLNSGRNVQKEPADLNGLIQENIQLLRHKANEKCQRIVLDPDEQPLVVEMNRERMSRLLVNLVTNAVKFSRQDTEIHVGANRDGNEVFIKVSDQGIGIPQHQLQRIFDVFTAAKRKGTAGEQSFGLGLSICRQIAEEHGGNISVQSEEGKGTVFTVVIPLL